MQPLVSELQQRFRSKCDALKFPIFSSSLPVLNACYNSEKFYYWNKLQLAFL